MPRPRELRAVTPETGTRPDPARLLWPGARFFHGSSRARDGPGRNNQPAAACHPRHTEPATQSEPKPITKITADTHAVDNGAAASQHCADGS